MRSIIACIRSLPAGAGLALVVTVPPVGGSFVITLCGGTSGAALAEGDTPVPVGAGGGMSVAAPLFSGETVTVAEGGSACGELAVHAATAVRASADTGRNHLSGSAMSRILQPRGAERETIA